MPTTDQQFPWSSAIVGNSSSERSTKVYLKVVIILIFILTSHTDSVYQLVLRKGQLVTLILRAVAGSIVLTVMMRILRDSAGRDPNTRNIGPPPQRMTERWKTVTKCMFLRLRRSMMQDWRGRKMNVVRQNAGRSWDKSGSSMKMSHNARMVYALRVGVLLVYFTSCLMILQGRGRMKYIDPEVHQRRHRSS